MLAIPPEAGNGPAPDKALMPYPAQLVELLVPGAPPGANWMPPLPLNNSERRVPGTPRMLTQPPEIVPGGEMNGGKGLTPKFPIWVAPSGTPAEGDDGIPAMVN